MTLNVEKILTDLRAQHLRSPNRRAQTALDVPAAVWLWNACEREGARHVLELGSGFSSWALHHWEQRAAADRGTAPFVWTIDDDPHWLGVTARELEALRMPGVLDDFGTVLNTDPHDSFDIVFVDLGDTKIRRRHAADFVRWTKPGGILVLDDWHMPHYRDEMTDLLLALGVVVKPIPETIDEWGRYMAVGRKQA